MVSTPRSGRFCFSFLRLFSHQGYGLFLLLLLAPGFVGLLFGGFPGFLLGNGRLNSLQVGLLTGLQHSAAVLGKVVVLLVEQLVAVEPLALADLFARQQAYLLAEQFGFFGVLIRSQVVQVGIAHHLGQQALRPLRHFGGGNALQHLFDALLPHPLFFQESAGNVHAGAFMVNAAVAVPHVVQPGGNEQGFHFLVSQAALPPDLLGGLHYLAGVVHVMEQESTGKAFGQDRLGVGVRTGQQVCLGSHSCGLLV
jgi:hypothetical protein